MYSVLNKLERMNRAQIAEMYKGKWFFLVDAEGPNFGTLQYNGFETALPAVVTTKRSY